MFNVYNQLVFLTYKSTNMNKFDEAKLKSRCLYISNEKGEKIASRYVSRMCDVCKNLYKKSFE